MAQCNLCGKRYWFFSQHKCEIKPRQTNSTQTRSSDFYRSIASDTNEHIKQQQLIHNIALTSSNDDTCRSTPVEDSYSHRSDSTNVTSSNHCHSYSDSSNSYSSDSSSSSYDSGSSSSSSWD